MSLEIRIGPARVRIVGTIHGLVSEALSVENAFRAFEPDAVGLGIAPSELEGLESHLAGAAAEEDDDEVHIDPGESYALGLSRFGEIGLPPADLLAAITLSRDRGIDPVALDLDSTQYDEVFTRNVGWFALFRYGKRVQRMGERPPEARSAREFALAWDGRIRDLKGFDSVEKAREAHMALRLEALAAGKARVLAIVDVAREDGIRREAVRRNPQTGQR